MIRAKPGCFASGGGRVSRETELRVGRRLRPADRLAELCDPGSFSAIRSRVASRRLGVATDGDGVVAGAGTIGGEPVFCYAQDPAFMGGSLGAAHADSIVRVLELAGRAKAPVVAFVESGGARLQEGHDALAGYGRIFRASVALARRRARRSRSSPASRPAAAPTPRRSPTSSS